jgi:hypothetical protein
MLAPILFAFVAAQSSTTEAAAVPSGAPSGAPGLPTISPECITYLQEQSKPLEAVCGASIPTSVNRIQQLAQALDKVCSKACMDGLNEVVTKAATATQCSSATGSLESFSAMFKLGTAVMCVKTTDNKGYCLAEQMKLFPELATTQDPTALFAQNVNNLKLICTDCFQKQIKAVADSGAIPAEFNTVITQLDAGLAETCKPNGGITVLAGTGSATGTGTAAPSPSKTSSAMAMTGMGAFVAAAVLVL